MSHSSRRQVMGNHFTEVSFMPLGAANSIGRAGYCYTFKAGNGTRPFRVLVDTGIQPGFEWHPQCHPEDAFPRFDLAGSVDAIIITHSHADHMGALMVAAKRYPNVPIFMSKETKALVKQTQSEFLRFYQQGGLGTPNPFSMEEVATLCSTRIHEFKNKISLADGKLQVDPHAAGHILGAEMISFTFGRPEEEETILHTGDMSTHPQTIIGGAEQFNLKNGVAAVVTDSTYLGIDYDREAETKNFLQRTDEVLSEGGIALLPSFSNHRGQELWSALRSHGIPNNQIHVAGPAMGKYFEHFHALRPDLCLNAAQVMDKPRGVWLRETEVILEMGGPAVIIASGGMGNGAAGACIRELLDVGREKDKIFFTGYCDPCTDGGRLLGQCEAQHEEGRYFTTLGDDGSIYAVQDGTVERFHLSAHAYHGEMETFWSGLRPRQILCVHGDDNVIDASIEKHPEFEGAPFVKTFVGTQIPLIV